MLSLLLQVKCLRVLQYFPPPEDPVVSKQLNTILKQIVASTLLTSLVLHRHSLHRLSCHMLTVSSLNSRYRYDIYNASLQ